MSGASELVATPRKFHRRLSVRLGRCVGDCPTVTPSGERNTDPPGKCKTRLARKVHPSLRGCSVLRRKREDGKCVQGVEGTRKTLVSRIVSRCRRLL